MEKDFVKFEDLKYKENSIYYEENGTDWDVTHVRDAEHRI